VDVQGGRTIGPAIGACCCRLVTEGTRHRHYETAVGAGVGPRFPSPVADDTEPGTVFQTDHAGRRSIWTVIRRKAGTTIQHATTTPEP
jgi:hypothetical protein